MLRFDPNALAQEFDPAIVTLFEHENVGHQIGLDLIMTAYGQYYDLFVGYLYAKDEVLPFIREKGRGAITPEILLHWLHQAHARIALRLGKAVGFTAGEYTHAQVFRWHWGNLTSTEMLEHIGGVDRRDEILTLAKKNQMSSRKAEEFIQLLEKIRDTIGIEFESPPTRQDMGEGYAEMMGSEKLIFAYHNHQLNADDLSILSEVVAIPVPPAECAAVMHQFAVDFVREWALCDKGDDKQIAELFLKAYRGIAGIHAYSNGNGRLATWLLNVIARSLDKPSFLMREPGERFNQQSSYHEAIEQIDKNPELFKKHVLMRMNNAANHGRSEHPLQYQVVCKRVEVYQLHCRILSEHPAYDLHVNARMFNMLSQGRLIQKFGMERMMALEPVIMLEAAEQEFDHYQKIYLGLNAKLAPRISNIVSVTAHQYSKDEVGQISTLLRLLTGESHCKYYNKVNVMLLHLTDDKNHKSIMEILIRSGAMKVELKLMADEGNPELKKHVLKLTNINLPKLRTYQASLPVVDAPVQKTGSSLK